MEYKTKATNTFKDTDNRQVVTRVVEGWGEDEEGKGGEIFSDKRRLDLEQWAYNGVYNTDVVL